MKAIVTLEHRFRMTPDGTAWSKVMFPYSFWQRYLEVFDSVRIVARALPVNEVDDGWTPATGPSVDICPLPYYVGPAQYLRKARKLKDALRRGYLPDAAIILRVPSHIATLIIPLLEKKRHPYALEVVGDPWDVMSPKAFRHPLRPVFRWRGYFDLRRLCKNAAAVAYVTEHALQRRYPPAPGAFTTHYSSVQLQPEAFVAAPRAARQAGRIRLVSIGTLETLYKGPDVLLHALSKCVHRDAMDLELVWIGDGKHRRSMEALSSRLNLADRVAFRGQLPRGEAVRAELDASDVFVLASRTEGLPRAVIEAMARALPCIATDAGGLAELLPPASLVAANDERALAAKIREVLLAPERLTSMSARNLHAARLYSDDALHSQRQQFYTYIRDATARHRPNSRS